MVNNEERCYIMQKMVKLYKLFYLPTFTFSPTPTVPSLMVLLFTNNIVPFKRLFVAALCPTP